MKFLIVAFWWALAAIALTYLAFPLLILGRGVVRRGASRHGPTLSGDGHGPMVSVIVAAHNEEGAIGAKIRSILDGDYPAHRREILVVSDGCVDATDAVVESFAGMGVRLISLGRVGKAAALNAGVAASTGSVLVFTDANSVLAPDALRALVDRLRDGTVGAVAGDQRYTSDRSGGVSGSERRYWSLDRALKEAESRAGSAVSATGALYAIRRELFEPVPEGVTDDFFISTGAVQAGRRLVFAPEAVAYEPVEASASREFDRKVRIITRGLRAVLLRRDLLNPRLHGFYAVQLLWHKVLRRIVAVPLVVLAVVAPLLWSAGGIYRLVTMAQGAFYAVALLGLALLRRGGRASTAFYLPAYFVMVNVAVLRALWNILTDHRIERWEPARSDVGMKSVAD